MPIWNAPNQTQVKYLLLMLCFPKRAKRKVNQLRNGNFHKLNPQKDKSAEVFSSPLLTIKLLQISILLSFMHMPSFCCRFWRERERGLVFSQNSAVSFGSHSFQKNDHQSPMLRQAPAYLPICLMLSRVRDVQSIPAVTGRYSVAP